MVTRWDDIRQRLRGRWTVEHDDPAWCGVVIDLEHGRQKVVVKPTVGLARDQVIVAAQVCALGAAEPTTALRYNAVAPRGAIALEQGAYVLRELVEYDDVELAVDVLATEAMRLRRATTQQRWNDAVMHYAD